MPNRRAREGLDTSIERRHALPVWVASARTANWERRTLLKAAGAAIASGALGCEGHAFLGVNYTAGTRVYPSRPSLFPGQTLRLHVSTSAPEFRVELYRVGATRERLQVTDWFTGVLAPIGRPDEEWDFTAYDIQLAASVRPGVYLARVVEGEGGAPVRNPSLAAQRGLAEALFVVKNPSPRAGGVLYKLPLATYHAYNFTGGGSLYHVAFGPSGEPLFHLHQPGGKGQPAGTKISLRRPGGGAGADTTEPIDVYDRRSTRNTFEHWDAHFIRWLEREQFDVDYCVGLDVHREGALLAPYSTLICAGHDEYWSEPERDHVEQFAAAGGNVAFFCGNTCWWRVHYVDDDTALVCDKQGHVARDQWYASRPEDSLTGVSYRFGGGRWKGARPVVGYRVQHPEHWVFEGTGLQQGDVFGADPQQPLVGYECDSAPYRRDHDGTAVVVDCERYGTPSEFVILGVAELNSQWARRGRWATMGAYTTTGGGEVFNAATTDWVKLLDRDAAVTRITRNVLARFAAARASAFPSAQ